jgi:rRNA maturation protein Nop10
VVNVDPLPGKGIAPPLELHQEYTLKDVCFDKEGNPHLDVGLPSTVNFVKSYETGEELPDGHKIHWCHPSRFAKVTKAAG